MTNTEKQAWVAFKDVVEGFLGNERKENYKELVTELLRTYHLLGCNTSIKIHSLHSRLEYFPDNLGKMSDEQGERFHQDIKEMERRYQGRWDVNMMADYCWCLKRDSDVDHKRKTRKRSFLTSRKHKSYHNIVNEQHYCV
ncbi:hypothetical protein AVEN_246582-1 [Araneus ventricosus]|uniref:Uncharacterized protein n=1 Tax=Araneus ventricosus TaxID=182803 RepID=A0A4Y2DEB7_ARAVE|nr:hypothetical protein AVEN_246582-1 [Araneus ventricosus]